MFMGFFWRWPEQQSQKDGQPVVLAGSPHSWVGRRVWCSGFEGQWVYGEVASIIEQCQMARVVIGYDPLGRPLYWDIGWYCFGRSVLFVDSESG